MNAFGALFSILLCLLDGNIVINVAYLIKLIAYFISLKRAFIKKSGRRVSPSPISPIHPFSSLRFKDQFIMFLKFYSKADEPAPNTAIKTFSFFTVFISQ